MDERHRDYLKYVEMVSGTKDAQKVDHAATEQDAQMDHLLQEIRDENFSSEYNMLKYFIISATVIVVIMQYIQIGATVRMLVLLLPVFFFIYNRAKVKSHTKKINQAKSAWALKKEEAAGIRGPYRAEYIREGLALNHTRIANTKWLYILLAPFVMFFILEMGRGPFTTNAIIGLLVFALIANVVLWNYVFSGDLNQVAEWQEDERLVFKQRV